MILDSFFTLQVAVCNLASLALNMYVTSEHTYDFTKLAEVTKVIVRNLNKIIDINYYPIPEVRIDFSADGLLKLIIGLIMEIQGGRSLSQSSGHRLNGYHWNPMSILR